MSDLRQAAQQALDALEEPHPGVRTSFTDAVKYREKIQKAITALRTALEQQAEPVSHAVIVGALFDFMGWLTTRKERLILSSTDNASPAADAIKDFAEMRGLLLDDAKVQDWQAYTTPPQRQWDKPGTSFNDWWNGDYDDSANPFEQDSAAYWAWAGWKAGQRQWVGLTHAQTKECLQAWDENDAYALCRAIEAKLKERNHDR